MNSFDSRKSKPVRILIAAWLTVAAVVGLAYFFAPDAELSPSQIDAAYELQPARRPRVAFDDVAELTSETAPITSGLQAPDPIDDEVLDTLRAEEGDESGARLYGSITYRGTREAVVGVRLRLESIDRRNSWALNESRTADDGSYEFTGLSAGTYALSFAIGETADALPPEVAPVVHLTSKAKKRLDITVSRGGRVWGRVVDVQGRPVADAIVMVGTTESVVSQILQAAARRRVLIGKSDANGNYAVGGVPFEKEWRVFVDKSSSSNGPQAPGDFAPLLSPSFVLYPSRPHIRMDVTLLAGTTISGRVLDVEGKGIAEADLTCMPRYSALLAPTRSAKTLRRGESGPDGSFVLKGLPRGEYQIMAFKKEYRVSFKGTPVYPDGRSNIAGVKVVLRAIKEGRHAVFGVVTDAGGAPIAGAHVGLAAFGLESLSVGGQDTNTGADGAFRFEGVGDGLFLLTAEKDGYRPQFVERVRVDTKTTLALDSQSSLKGIVRFPSGRAAPQPFTVRVVRVLPEAGAPGSFLASLETLESERGFEDPSGAFELTRVPLGTLVLEARAPGFAPGRTEVRVGLGEETSGVEIRLPREAASIRGRVVDIGGRPLEGVTISLAEVGAGSGGVLALLDRRRQRTGDGTDESGAFEVSGLAVSTYRLTAQHDGFAPSTLPSLVTRPGQSTEIEIVLGTGGTIAGRTRPGVMITVAGEGFSTLEAADDEGGFSVERVPPGDYLVRAVSSEGDLTQAPEVWRAIVVVQEGQIAQLDFTERPSGRRVTGRLESTLAEGDLAMAMLRIPGSPEPDPRDLVWQGELGVEDPETSRTIVAEALAGRDGTYTFENVPLGTYVLDVYRTTLFSTLTGNPATLTERREITVD